MAVIDDILTASGVQFRETRFTKPPAGTYAVYTDDVDADGPDNLNRIYTHGITVELYSPTPDAEAEAAVEAAIDAAGLHWTKQARYWIQEEQLYQVIYEFTYYTKRRT